MLVILYHLSVFPRPDLFNVAGIEPVYEAIITSCSSRIQNWVSKMLLLWQLLHMYQLNLTLFSLTPGDIFPEQPSPSISEDDLFSCEAQSMASVHSADRSADSIVQRRSRVSSQENGRLISFSKLL